MNPEFILGGVAPGGLAIKYFQLGRKICNIFDCFEGYVSLDSILKLV